MKQAKRLFYIVVLNIVISSVTVVVVLNLWQRSHPPLSAQGTPAVLVVTSTQSVSLPVMASQVGTDGGQPTDTGILATATPLASPNVEMLVYQVKKGDTLGALSVQFNISVADIMTVNGMTDPDSLYEGQIIHIPTSPLPTFTPTLAATETPSATKIPSATPTRGPTSSPTPTQVSLEPAIHVEMVIGAGELSNERVVLKRTGDGELSLAGWRLEDGAGHRYTFPQLTLYKDSSISLNTRSGEDTVLDLYWGLPAAIWSSGKTVSLYDGQHQLRSSYTIP